MAQLQLHATLPEAASSEYSPYQTVDFLILAPGRKLVANSIRIEGDIVAKKNDLAWMVPTAANPVTPMGAVDFDSNIKLDNMVGAHGFFDSFTTETATGGVLETLSNYPRFISQHARATLAQDDLMSSKMCAEARGPTEINGNYVLQPVVDQAYIDPAGGGTSGLNGLEQPQQRSKPAFSLAPQILFNRSVGGNGYSFDKSGYIRVSCILAPNSNALFGGADGVANYTLENLQCRYTTVPDDGVKVNMMCRSYVNVVSSIQSTSTTITARVPSSSVNSVTMSFASQSHLNSTEFNSYALESLPQFDNISYLFANSMQNYVTYVIRDDGDALSKGLESLESAGHNQVSAKTIKGNRGTIMGLAFDEYIDLTQQRFTVEMNLLSDTITGNPFSAYLYFNTMLQL